MWLKSVAQHLYPTLFLHRYIQKYIHIRTIQSYMHSISADALMKDHFAIHAVTTIAMLEINYFLIKMPSFIAFLYHFMTLEELWVFFSRDCFYFFFLRGSDSSRVHHPAIYWYALFTYNFLQTLILNLSICMFIDYQSCIYRVVPAALRSNVRIQRQRDVNERREMDVNGVARTFTFTHITFHIRFLIYNGYSDEISYYF